MYRHLEELDYHLDHGLMYCDKASVGFFAVG